MGAAMDGLPSVERFFLSFAPLWQCSFCGAVYATDFDLPFLIVGDKYQCTQCAALEDLEQSND